MNFHCERCEGFQSTATLQLTELSTSAHREEEINNLSLGYENRFLISCSIFSEYMKVSIAFGKSPMIV